MQVLIVDDVMEETRVIASAISGFSNVDAISFTSADQALAWAATSEPIVVVVDYQMPQMNGIEFMQRVRALPGKSDTPVVLVTADEDLGVRPRALEMGVNDFVTKPFHVTDMRERIWLALDTYRLGMIRERQASLAQANIGP